jgi:hypothetical protein
MSSIKLTADSGGGTFELKAPSSSANTRVLTLPDRGNLTLDGGKIGQFSQTLNDYNYSTSSTSLTDVLSASGVTAEYAMTPSLSSSKILFTANMFINALNVSLQEHRYQLSLQAKIGSGSYNAIEVYSYLGQYNYTGANALLMNSIPIPFSFLYSPSTTSAVTFKMQVKVYSGSANLNFNNADKASQINLFEVLA